MTNLRQTDELFFSRTGLDRIRLEGIVDDTLATADDGELFLEYRQSESVVHDLEDWIRAEKMVKSKARRSIPRRGLAFAPSRENRRVIHMHRNFPKTPSAGRQPP